MQRKIFFFNPPNIFIKKMIILRLFNYMLHYFFYKKTCFLYVIHFKYRKITLFNT